MSLPVEPNSLKFQFLAKSQVEVWIVYTATLNQGAEFMERIFG